MNNIKIIWGKIKIFIIDHFHLLFKSTKKNYERINSQGTCFVNKEANRKLTETNLKFDSFNHLEHYQKKIRKITFSSSFTIVLVLAIVIGFQLFGSHSDYSV